MRIRLGRLVTALAALFVLVPAGTALAHATLISTSPAHGSTVESPPAAVELRFDGPVTPVADAFTLRSGDRTIQGEVRVDATLVSFIPSGAVPDGTAVLDWRVVSDDGHPIGGKLVFHVREATVTVTDDGVAAEEAGPAVAVLTALSHLGILLGAGLSFFASWVLEESAPEAARLRSLTRPALAVGVVAAAASLFLQGAEIAGRVDLGSLPPGSLPMLVLLALGTGLLWVSVHPVSVAVGLLPAVTSLAFVGHTRSFGPLPVMFGADVVHLVAATVWAGGLAGLVVVARRRGRETAEVARRFGSIAAWCLAGVFLSGAVMTVLIHDSPRQVLSTVHGRLALVKAALVVGAAGIALLNRRSASGRGEPERLGLMVPVEAVIVAVVLVVAGFLVEQNPAATTGSEPIGDQVMQAALGEHGLSVRFEPGAPGVNTVAIQVTAPDGTPADLAAAPKVSIARAGEATSYDTAPDGAGWSATVELPDAPSWSVEVRARLDTFTEAVQVIRSDRGRVLPGSGLLVTRAVLPAPVTGMTNASVYMTVVPASDGALVGASSPVCERISLHETRTNDDGTVAMLYQERLDLVAGEPLVFRSGGLHLMCEGIVRQVNPGEVVPLYLETADGARQLLMVDVIRIADLVD